MGKRKNKSNVVSACCVRRGRGQAELAPEVRQELSCGHVESTGDQKHNRARSKADTTEHLFHKMLRGRENMWFGKRR